MRDAGCWMRDAMALLCLFVIVGGCVQPAAKAPTKLVLKSFLTDRAPSVDGRADSVWKHTKATTIPMSDKTKVTMKSVYTKDKVYFLLKWRDAHPDDGVVYWEYDGKKWNIDWGGDMLGFIWNVSFKDFDKKGCNLLCHRFLDGKFHMKIRGRNSREKPFKGYKQRADVWKWVPGVMNNLNLVDDGIYSAPKYYVSSPQAFGAIDLWIRFERDADSGTSPPWFRNENALEGTAGEAEAEARGEVGMPSLKLKDGLTIEQKPFPTESDMEKITNYSIFKAGDKIPEFYYLDTKSPANKALFPRGRAEGSRVDVKGHAIWKNGEWTLEIERKLNTGHGQEDVQFDPNNASKNYVFAIGWANDLTPEDFYKHATSKPITLQFVR